MLLKKADTYDTENGKVCIKPRDDPEKLTVEGRLRHHLPHVEWFL